MEIKNLKIKVDKNEFKPIDVNISFTINSKQEYKESSEANIKLEDDGYIDNLEDMEILSKLVEEIVIEVTK